MRIKRLVSGFLAAVMSICGVCAFADGMPENNWLFETETDLPEHFSYNNAQVPVYYSNSGKDGRAFGFAAGAGVGKGNGTLSETTNGMNIYKDEITPQTDGIVTVSYDMLIENDNLCAYLIAPRFEGKIFAALQLRAGVISFEGEEIAVIGENEWHSIGVQYDLDGGSVGAKVYFDGIKRFEAENIADIPSAGIEYFSVLVNSDTTTEEFRANTKYEGRNEILRMDNLYIGTSGEHLKGEFKAVSVSQGDGFDSINIVFNNNINAEAFKAEYVSVSGIEIDDYVINGRTLRVILASPMAKDETYTVNISERIAGADDTGLTGQTEFYITAAMPKTVNMLWDFNDGAKMPEYFSYNNKEVPVITTDIGPNGTVGDSALRFLIGIGGGCYDKNSVMDRYNNGFRILYNALDSVINDVQLVYDYDFCVWNNNLIAWLYAPSYGTGVSAFYKPIELTEGVVSFDGTEIGEIEANEWHNLGVVCTLSSGRGIEMDIYFDGIKKISGYTDNSSTAKSGIGYFAILAGAHTSEEDYAISSRFDGRNEYFGMDNLYIGNDVSRVIKNLAVESSSPAGGETSVSADTKVKVLFNDKLENTDASGLIWLTEESGNRIDFETINITDDGRGLEGTLAAPLNWRERYRVNFSDSLISQYGKRMQANTAVEFVTESAYAAELDGVNITRADNRAAVDAYVNGHSADAVLIACSYDAAGVMIDAASQAIGANGSRARLDIACPEGSAVKVFAVDSLKSGRLIAEPYIENEIKNGYRQRDTKIELNDAKCLDRVITVSGKTNTKSGYLFGRISESGTENSDNVQDYLCIDAVRCDESGNFSFAGMTNLAKGSYKYSVTAPDNGETVSAEVSYTVETGNKILTMSLNGSECAVNGQNISLTASEKDLSGMLAKFTLSDRASLYLGSECLVSGVSRINCSKNVELTVVSELGEKNVYTLKVTAAGNTTVGGGGGNGGGGGSNSFTAYVSADDITDKAIAEPYKEQRFEDVGRTYWAYDAIETLTEMGIVSGVSETCFEPERLVTREEFASLLQRAFGYTVTETASGFEDIPEDAWYHNAVYALAERGIVNGIADGRFGIGSSITRQDMAAMAYRCIKDSDVEFVREYKGFTDESDISGYAAEAVQEMYCSGLVSGMEDGSFRPSDGTTRAQAAYMISRLIGLKNQLE